MASAGERPLPSVVAAAVASAIIAGLAGYFLGQAKTLGLFGSTPTRQQADSSKGGADVSDISDAEIEAEAESESDDEEDDSQGELNSFAGNTEECKLVLVVRTDLGMTKGMSSRIQHPHTSSSVMCHFSLLPPIHTPHIRDQKAAISASLLLSATYILRPHIRYCSRMQHRSVN